MNTDALFDVFEKALSAYPELPIGNMKRLLKQSLETKKYDAQDEAIIEAVLNEQENHLGESYKEVLDNYLKKIESEATPEDFLKSEEGQNKAVEIFIYTLDNLIDYFYNLLISKHFS